MDAELSSLLTRLKLTELEEKEAQEGFQEFTGIFMGRRITVLWDKTTRSATFY